MDTEVSADVMTHLDKVATALLLLRIRDGVNEKEQGSVEGVLFKAGFAQHEIVELTGVPESTLRHRLKSEGLK